MKLAYSVYGHICSFAWPSPTNLNRASTDPKPFPPVCRGGRWTQVWRAQAKGEILQRYTEYGKGVELAYNVYA